MSREMVALVINAIAAPLSAVTLLSLIGYSWRIPWANPLGLGRRNIARLYVLSGVIDLVEDALDPGPLYLRWLNGACTVGVAYLVWRWRDDDDDEFTKRRKRFQKRLSEALRAKFRVFAPSPLPSPA